MESIKRFRLLQDGLAKGLNHRAWIDLGSLRSLNPILAPLDCLVLVLTLAEPVSKALVDVVAVA